MPDTERLLDALVRESPAAAPWFERALSSADEPLSLAFRAAYASVPRRLGDARSEQIQVVAALLAVHARPHWTLSDWVRAALVTRALAKSSVTEHGPLLLKLFEGGEIGEQESLLRTLMLLPSPEAGVDLALAACRNNTRRVFEAIACENAFPAQYLPEPGFNQLVLKAIFSEVSARRIEGLAQRITPDLKRMAEAYASERRAAARSVPEDCAWIVAEPESTFPTRI